MLRAKKANICLHIPHYPLTPLWIYVLLHTKINTKGSGAARDITARMSFCLYARIKLEHNRGEEEKREVTRLFLLLQWC